MDYFFGTFFELASSSSAGFSFFLFKKLNSFSINVTVILGPDESPDPKKEEEVDLLSNPKEKRLDFSDSQPKALKVIEIVN